MSTTYSAGLMTAYGAAKDAGYTGTYAQFCQAMRDLAGIVASATTLPAGSSATAEYNGGTLSLGIPKGDTGATGATGATGNGIVSVTKTGTSGLVDTYTITFTNGTTTTFEITNGEDGEVTQAQLDAVIDDVDDLKTAFNNYNLFNKRTASIISVMGNSSGGLVSGGGVSSVAIPCEPSTQYTLSFWGGNRRLLWETEAYPAVGGTWLVNDGELSVTSETIDGNNRYKKTITTSANTHYLLLYFYTNSTGAEDVPNTVQLELGDTMHEYGAFDMPQLQVMTSQIFEDDKVANILGYRALGALNKGYICLVADDGTSDIADVSFAIAQNKNVPITFALWSTSACVTDSTLRTQLLDMVANHNCSVAQHGEGYFTNYTTDQLIEYLESEKSAFDALGITTKGIAYPNHAHNGTVRAVCGSMYEVCCTGGASANKDHVYANDTLGTRSNQFALYRVSTYSTSESALKTACDYAYANNKLLIIWWHDNDVAGESAQLTKLNNVIDYAKTKGLEFVTVGEIPYL